jgi:hypothetical protein
VDASVVESIWRTSATAGVLQREVGLAPRALGFTYDTGPYLQLRACDPDEFQLAYAATLSDATKYADADRLVGEPLDRRPGWLDATWVRVAICHRTERWSDVVRLLTTVVNDPSLDEVTGHAARVTLGIAFGPVGHVRARTVPPRGAGRADRGGGRGRCARQGAFAAGPG